MEARQKEIAENEQAINRVLNTAIAKNGPVHLNLPFEEPLYDTTTDTIVLNHKAQSKLQYKLTILAHLANAGTAAKRKYL